MILVTIWFLCEFLVGIWATAIFSTKFASGLAVLLTMRTMSSDDSDSEFHEFVADLNQTLPTGLENDSDISVSSVETGKLSQVAMMSRM